MLIKIPTMNILHLNEEDALVCGEWRRLVNGSQTDVDDHDSCMIDFFNSVTVDECYKMNYYLCQGVL